MQIIESPEELVAALKEIKKRAFFDSRIFVLGGPNKGYAKYTYTHHHETIVYEGYHIDVKTPKLAGELFINIPRPIGERYFNDGFVVYEKPAERMQREAETYNRLYKAGFPTLHPLQWLIPTTQEGKPLVRGILLTERIPVPQPIIDCIDSSDRQSLTKITDVSALMKSMHKEHGQAWGDPWFGNAFYDKDRLLIVDFGFKPNPKLTSEVVYGKDLVGLCLTSVYWTKLSPREVVGRVLEGYQPSDEVSASLEARLTNELENPPNPIMRKMREYLYYRFVFGLDDKQVAETKREIIRQIA